MNDYEAYQCYGAGEGEGLAQKGWGSRYVYGDHKLTADGRYHR